MGDAGAGWGETQAHVPSFSYVLFDLHSVTTERIATLAVASSLKLFLLVMKHIHDSRLPQLLNGWHELIGTAVRTDPTGLRLLEVLPT